MRYEETKSHEELHVAPEDNFFFHNSADNCFFSPIYEELEEFIYAKRQQNIFDQSRSEFVSSEYLERQIEKEFPKKNVGLDPNDGYYEARKKIFEMQKKKEIDAVFSMKKLGKIKHKKIL